MQSLLDKMGRRTVDAFARLYVLPQGNHGMTATTAPIDGNGKEIPATRLPTTWNRFGLLVDWVEKNTAPAKTITDDVCDQSLPPARILHTRDTERLRTCNRAWLCSSGRGRC